MLCDATDALVAGLECDPAFRRLVDVNLVERALYEEMQLDVVMDCLLRDVLDVLVGYALRVECAVVFRELASLAGLIEVTDADVCCHDCHSFRLGEQAYPALINNTRRSVMLVVVMHDGAVGLLEAD